MKLAYLRTFGFSALVLLERCASVVARPNTYMPYQLYNYEQLNTANQRYWLLNPTENAPKDAKPVLFGVINTTDASSANHGSQSPFKVHVKYLAPAGEQTVDSVTRQAAQDSSISLPPSAKPIFTNKDLSAIIAKYATHPTTPTNQPPAPPAPPAPPRFVPDATPDPGLKETFGNIGILIGSQVGGPIGIVIGSAIGAIRPLGDLLGLPRGVDIVIGTVIGYGIGTNVGGPIGDFIGGQAGSNMAALLKAGSP